MHIRIYHIRKLLSYQIDPTGLSRHILGPCTSHCTATRLLAVAILDRTNFFVDTEAVLTEKSIGVLLISLCNVHVDDDYSISIIYL